MLKRIIRFIKGYLYVELRGCSKERFVNLCRYHNIFVWRLRIENDKCTFNILLADYRKLLPIAAKTKTYPHILKRYGVPFLIAELLRRRSLLPAVVLFAVVLYGLSFFVWDITITGQCRHTYEELNEYLEDIGYKPGMFRNNVNGKELETMIRNTYNDISWVSVELSGCNIHIKLIESDIMDAKSTAENECSDIIASSDGVVESIITRAGTPCVSVGDTVTKGQVLVSGAVELHDDGGNVTECKYVFADADISLKTVYPYKDVFSMIYDEKKYTGRSKKSYRFLINNTIFFVENLLNEFECYRKCDIINNNIGIKQMRIIDDSFCIDKTTYYEYDIVSKTYTNEQACALAREHLHQYMCDLSDDSVCINDKKVSVKISDGICNVSGELYVTEPQRLRQNISYDNIQSDRDNELNGE